MTNNEKEINLLNLDENYISSFGTKYWNIIHLEALKLTFEEIYPDQYNFEHLTKRKLQYKQMFEYLITNLKCNCKNHAYQILMINSNKIYKYSFQYTIDFHNQVNLRLGKPIVTYKQALDLYKPYIDVKKLPILNPFTQLSFTTDA